MYVKCKVTKSFVGGSSDIKLFSKACILRNKGGGKLELAIQIRPPPMPGCSSTNDEFWGSLYQYYNGDHVQAYPARVGLGQVELFSWLQDPL